MNWGPLLLLVGLVAVGWWRKPAAPDHDRLVGRGFWYAIKAHKPYTDWLDWGLNVYSLRGLPLMAAYFGAPPAAWATLAVAWGSRLIGTDGARFMFWAAPVLIRALPPDVPVWMVMVQAVSFKRMI